MKNSTISGWLNIDKPEGYSSAKVVAIIKRLLNAKKVGHGGTLDPLATGVLPICINSATKTTEKIMKGKKSYLFHILFGEERDTDDLEGNIINKTDYIPNEEEIKKILGKFIGEIEQMPPIFSALKVDGKRAYDLARNGKEVKLEPRLVSVYDLKFNGFIDEKNAEFIVECGKGFYVRSLARDLAKSVGSLGCISKLIRTKVEPFTIENSLTIEKVKEAIENNEIEGYLLNN